MYICTRRYVINISCILIGQDSVDVKLKRSIFLQRYNFVEFIYKRIFIEYR